MSQIKLKTPQEDHLWLTDIENFELFEDKEQFINYLLERNIYKICNDLDSQLPMYELSEIIDDEIWDVIYYGILSFRIIKYGKRKK